MTFSIFQNVPPLPHSLFIGLESDGFTQTSKLVWIIEINCQQLELFNSPSLPFLTLVSCISGAETTFIWLHYVQLAHVDRGVILVRLPTQ